MKHCVNCGLEWEPDRYVATEHGLKPECPVCELRSQLAAQASAVDVLGKVEEMLRKDSQAELRCDVIGDCRAELHCTLKDKPKAVRYRATLLEALAALVNDQSAKEESK